LPPAKAVFRFGVKAGVSPVESEPTRAELIEARDRIATQLEWLRTPSRGRDYNQTLIARLEGMLRDLNELLEEPGDANA
jgi:hypothetical protein